MATSNDPPGMPAPLQGQRQTPAPPRPMPSGLPTWMRVALVIIVLGVGILGGWSLGRAASTVPVSSSPSLQVGADQDAVRVNVIDKFRPSVVQINVTTKSGTGELDHLRWQGLL